MLNCIIKFFLENRLVTIIMLLGFVIWGIITSPFGHEKKFWPLSVLPSDPVPVDAIPDIGENQQIIFTNWQGRSPQDIEDQISYPLTTYLLGIPGVKSIRSSSMFGFSSIYIIFKEDIEYYWSRSRILEKLNAIPTGILPEGVQPTLGPDATALGQVFWYTIEGRDKNGNPTGGWDLQEIRTVQDFYVKYSLNAAEGVSEVASIGGYVKEYQIDVNPDALKAYNISLQAVMSAVRNSNKEVGAKTIEINQVEYLVRGLGYVKQIADIEKAVVAVNDNVPVRIKDIGVVTYGPASRRGILDKEGAEVVGGVVVARYGTNPLQVINNVKYKIEEIASGLPKKILADGTESQLTIVPFYDRSQLINETLGTLEEALSLEILISILVIVVIVSNLSASILIASLLPLSVLMVFIAMRYFNVEANIVALSGIAIAIGTMIDLGIILTENILKKLDELGNEEENLEERNRTLEGRSEMLEVREKSLEAREVHSSIFLPRYQRVRQAVYEGSAEVSNAILTAVSTTIVSFLPVFTLQAAEGKLFGPLAFTKTFALIAALIVSLLILPTLANVLFSQKFKNQQLFNIGIVLIGITFLLMTYWWEGFILIFLEGAFFFKNWYTQQDKKSEKYSWFIQKADLILIILAVIWLLANFWLPLGAGKSIWLNLLFVGMLVSSILIVFKLLEHYYRPILFWCLKHKFKFLIFPSILILLGTNIWLGFNTVFGFVSRGFDSVGFDIQKTSIWGNLSETFPGIGKEFMPALDEGSFLLMPTSMPHSGIEYNRKIVGQLDMLLSNIPEVEIAVGKLGRVSSALDPAPISMFENVINYKPEYKLDDNGGKKRFAVDEAGNYLLETLEVRNEKLDVRSKKLDDRTWKLDKEKKWIFDGKDTLYVTSNLQTLASSLQHLTSNKPIEELLIPDKNGQYYRNWRDEIKSSNDIWNEIVKVTKIPGITSAPKLQPIETRLVMLQTGMRSPMGIKVFGPDLNTIQIFSEKLEDILKNITAIKTETVFADRIIGKPYMHLVINRDEISRYGLNVEDVQNTIEAAVGGINLTTTIEGRERFPVRVRYPRELRDNPETIKNILISTPIGAQIPLGQLVEIEYERGPQAIKSEDTFLVGYVLFDKHDGFAEVDVVQEAEKAIKKRIDTGELIVPTGVSYKFSGTYENQIRAEKRLSIIIPLVLIIVFLILYFQFKSVTTSFMVFSGIAIAFAGGFIMIWLYGQAWFANFSFLETSARDLFQIESINLSVAVWVGFIALFGIATDDGVLMGTYLDQSFSKNQTQNISEIREAVIKAGLRRIRPAVMTSATTIIALLPILTSTGKGSDIMVPMAIPVFGGMIVAVISYFLVPVLYCWREEWRFRRKLEVRR